jgi:hypothetical protein
MKLIRYRTHPERADDNQRAVEAVFAELAAAAPPGVRYLVLRLPDATFIHLVTVDDGADASALTRLPAFQAFQAGIRERVIEPPQPSEVTIVGNHGMVVA